MLASLHTDLLICIALAAGRRDDEYVFNTLARAIPALGRYTLGVASQKSYTLGIASGENTAILGDPSAIISRRLDLMIIFGYNITFLEKGDGKGLNDRYGLICWQKYGDLHRNDVPAVIGRKDHYSTWYKHGNLHRVDGPAHRRRHNTAEWYQNGKLHRAEDDGPAIIWYGQWIAWCQNGMFHRDKGFRVPSGCAPWGNRNVPERQPCAEGGLQAGPAHISVDGHATWYQHDSPYHEEGPSDIWSAECKKWFTEKDSE